VIGKTEGAVVVQPRIGRVDRVAVAVADGGIENSGSATLSFELVQVTSQWRPGLLERLQRNCWRTKATRQRSLCRETVSGAATASTLTRCKHANISNRDGTEAIRTAK
jgi:hypothetical protein